MKCIIVAVLVVLFGWLVWVSYASGEEAMKGLSAPRVYGHKPDGTFVRDVNGVIL